MFKKEIKIPVGTICGSIIASTGVCTSLAVDKAIADTEMNKGVKVLGRIGASLIIGGVFTGIAFIATVSDDVFNIKIGGKKKKKSTEDIEYIPEPARPKDINRMDKVLSLWENIIKEISDVKIIIDNNDIINAGKSSKDIINIENIEDFNHIMKKLAKRIGFKYDKIVIDDDINVMVNNVSVVMDTIKDNFSEIFKYCYNRDIDEYEDSDYDELVGDLDDINDSLNSKISEEIFKIFNNSDVDLSVERFDELINNASDPKVVDIVGKFYNGEITLMDARDRLSAYIASKSESDNELEAESEISESIDADALESDDKKSKDKKSKDK